MTLFLTHDTALFFWRHYSAARFERFCGTLPFGNLAQVAKPTRTELDALLTPGAPLQQRLRLPLPIHICVPNDNSRLHDQRIVCHRIAAPLPPAAFTPVADGILVAGPELCFVQMAGRVSYPQLLQIGHELCGGYRMPSGMQGDFVAAKPLVKVHSIEVFTKRAANMAGIKAARRAAPFLCDNSNSPMETDIAVMLRLPVRVGGYGLAKPLMNHRMDVPPEMQDVLPQASFAIDFFWPDAALGLEYDSQAYHEGSHAVRDAIRSNGIGQLGVQLLSMTTAQALDRVEFDRIARIIARQTGKQTRQPSPRSLLMRKELRATLFARFSQDDAAPEG